MPTRDQVFIDVTNVPDLTAVSTTATSATVGAAVSLSQLLDLCHTLDPMAPTMSNDPATETVATATSSYSALARHLLVVANRQARVCAFVCACVRLCALVCVWRSFKVLTL